MSGWKRLELGVADVPEFDHVVDQYGHVVIVFNRRDVESMSIGRVVAALMALTDTPERVAKFKDAVIFSFDGWNEDPREVWEIPACVRFFNEVSEQWGYWYHFLFKDGSLFGVTLRMLAQRAALPAANDARLPDVCDRENVSKVMLRLFGPMNALYEACGIGLEANKAMTAKVERAVSKAMGG